MCMIHGSSYICVPSQFKGEERSSIDVLSLHEQVTSASSQFVGSSVCCVCVCERVCMSR